MGEQLAEVHEDVDRGVNAMAYIGLGLLAGAALVAPFYIGDMARKQEVGNLIPVIEQVDASVPADLSDVTSALKDRRAHFADRAENTGVAVATLGSFGLATILGGGLVANVRARRKNRQGEATPTETTEGVGK